MKLMDWIVRRPPAVGFGRGGGAAGGAAGAAAGAVDLASRAAIATRTLDDPAIVHLRTAGHAAQGDGGAALYVRAAAEPGHAGKAQSADGAWWELAAPAADTAQFGDDLALAIGYAQAKGVSVRVSRNCTLAASITAAMAIEVVPGARIAVGAGALLTLGQRLIGSCQQVFDLSAGGDVKFARAQDVLPEWFGTTNTALRDAFKKSAAGSRIVLRGVLYDSVAIAVNNDPLAVDGGDTGKVIEGPTPAQRYSTTGAFHGARIRLANAQNTDLFTVNSGGANHWGSGGLRNVMLQGNKFSNPTAGSGVKFLSVKDWELHNFYAWDFRQDGINLEGANNQINLTGYIECWNNGRDGIRAAAVGDPQWDAAIRCVNNDRHGLYIAGGYGRISQVYCYFNTEVGFYVETTAEKNLHIEFLRVEDNDKAGARIRGKNITIGAVEAADNGWTSTANTDVSGIWLDNCRDVTIGTVSAAVRTAAVRKQKFLIYDASAGGCVIDRINHAAYAAYVPPVAGEQTLFVVNPGQLGALAVGQRRTRSDLYSVLRNPDASLTPEPDAYGLYRVQSLTETTRINATATSRSPAGMELGFEIASSGAHSVTWDPLYVDQSGTALAPQAVGAGQTLHVRFRRVGGRWAQITPMVVV